MNDNNVIQARWHFGIPIYEKIVPEYEAYRQETVRRALALREQDQGLQRSNQGGWHSGNTLHTTDDPYLKPLIHSLLQIGSACVQDFEGEREYRDIRMVSAWLNINHEGDWNAPHEHLPCTWSGVFYLDAGTPLHSDPESLNGTILFFDPLPLGREWKRPPNIAYTPKTGSMLLFPSFLTHMVAPYHGSTPRLSLAFNLVVDR